MSNNHIVLHMGRLYYGYHRQSKYVLLVVGNACFKCLHHILI